MLESVWPFFVVSALLLYSNQFTRRPTIAALFSGVLLGTAVLVKMTAVCGVLALVVLILASNEIRCSVRQVLSALSGFALPILAHRVFLVSRYHDDYAAYMSSNVQQMGVRTVTDFVLNIRPTILFCRYVDPLIFGLALLSIVAASWKWRQALKRPFVCASIALLVSNIAILCMKSYHPPRYYVSLAIPLASLAAVFLCDIARKQNTFKTLACGLVGLYLCVNMLLMLGHLRRSSTNLYSFGIITKQLVESAPGSAPLVSGRSFVGTVGMTAGVPALNLEFGSKSREWKIAMYKPEWFVSALPVSQEDEAAFAQSHGSLRLSAAVNGVLGEKPCGVFHVEYTRAEPRQ